MSKQHNVLQHSTAVECRSTSLHCSVQLSVQQLSVHPVCRRFVCSHCTASAQPVCGQCSACAQPVCRRFLCSSTAVKEPSVQHCCADQFGAAQQSPGHLQTPHMLLSLLLPRRLTHTNCAPR
jgi:hypothetical protein